MPVKPAKKDIAEFLSRGVTHAVPLEELRSRLAAGNNLKLYLGVDPTSPVIHLGHSVALRKMRQLQDWGHKVILLIGEFTALIGDPSDKKSMRQPLTSKEIKENAKTYKIQAGKILNFTNKTNPISIKSNRQWLAKLNFEDLIKLSGNFTVQQMIERNMYQERIKAGKPIGLNEFFYPVMQGYDSVAMDVDLEVGGNDQLFNIMAGRTLMMNLKGKSKMVLTFEMLEGTDGRIMSKTLGNTIGLMDNPEEMYGKVMSLRDTLITRYFRLVTDVAIPEISKMDRDMKTGRVNPRDLKARLARELVTFYHSSRKADAAEWEFNKIFKEKKQPTDIPAIQVKVKEKSIVELLVEIKLVTSKSEARRLVEQGGVRVDEKVVKEVNHKLQPKKGMIVQVGKRRFVRLKV